MRSVQELLSASPANENEPANDEAVTTFLAEQRPTKRNASVKVKPVQNEAKKPGKPGKPIFQQS